MGLKWENGRQNTGYLKMKLFESKRFKFDLYLLYYPVGSKIHTHTDVVPGYEHHRINFVLREATEGGNFYCWHDSRESKLSRFLKFRPDIQPHGVFKITKGKRVVLSFGWLRRKK